MGEGQHPDSSKGIRKHVSSLGALGVGDSTRYSTKGIRNRASSPGCPGGGGQHPGFC